MANNIIRGLIAGAVGTMALDVATYADMALRARPASSIPSQLVEQMAQKVDLPLSEKGVGAQDDTTQNRASGLGALLGYTNGIGIGALYSLFQPQLQGMPLLLAGVGTGAAAMAASDVPLVSFKLTDPRTWGTSGWIADALPHFIYGIVTVGVYEMLRSADEDEDD
jgi:hypothetical protein